MASSLAGIDNRLASRFSGRQDFPRARWGAKQRLFGSYYSSNPTNAERVHPRRREPPIKG